MEKSTRLDWFKFFPANFITSPNVIMMSLASRGIYITLLCHCWLNAPNGAGIPAEESYLKAICNCGDKEWQENKEIVLKQFEIIDNKLYNKRLCKELDDANGKIDACRDSGIKSAERRINERSTNAERTFNVGSTNVDICRVEYSKSRLDKNTYITPEDVFRQAKRIFRKYTGKSIGSLGNRGNQWKELIESHGGDIILSAIEMWSSEGGRNLKNVDWPLAVFLKNSEEYIEAVASEREKVIQKLDEFGAEEQSVAKAQEDSAQERARLFREIKDEDEAAARIRENPDALFGG